MNAIEVKDLKKCYKNFTLDNITFTLPSGCIMGLVGQNGAGKTTIIKLLLSMIKKDGGEITLLGKEQANCSFEDIGIVTEENGFPECLNASEIHPIFNNIYKNWDREIYFAYLREFKIPLDKKIKAFSKGMKMKLYIAAALAHDAKLLILDEATSGLDPVMRDEILDIFNDFTRDEEHSILISSHIVSDLEKICDYIAAVHEGKLILFEEKDKLLYDYSIIKCDENTLKGISKNDILSSRKTDYGITAIIKKSAVANDMNEQPVNLEDLFVYMIRGQEK